MRDDLHQRIHDAQGFLRFSGFQREVVPRLHFWLSQHESICPAVILPCCPLSNLTALAESVSEHWCSKSSSHQPASVHLHSPSQCSICLLRAVFFFLFIPRRAGGQMFRFILLQVLKPPWSKSISCYEELACLLVVQAVPEGNVLPGLRLSSCCLWIFLLRSTSAQEPCPSLVFRQRMCQNFACFPF